MPTALDDSPLPEGRTLACLKCGHRVTAIGPFPPQRCPCGGTFRLAKASDVSTDVRTESSDQER